jgi:arsenate reductase
MPERLYNVLFLCTGNSARSILAEALLNHLGQGRFVAHSAGSSPSGKVNEYALATLRELSIPVGNPRSKGWDEFAAGGQGQSMDLIITVCDSAAGETCPVWPGHPALGHWGIPDPASVRGSDEAKRRAFRTAFETLQLRIRGLIGLPIADLTREQLKGRLHELANLWAAPVPGE